MKLSGFQDRTAFVTGAAGGIGRAVVTALRDAGARVYATDLGPELPPDQPQLLWRCLDVSDAEAMARAVADATRQLGPITLGVHAAGMLDAEPLRRTRADRYGRVMDVNAGGTFNLFSALGNHMGDQGRGAIAVIGSNAAGIPRMNMGAYGASKAAAAMLTRCMGLELAEQGVRCNLVAPGSTLTPMQTGMWSDDSGAARVIAGDPAGFKTGIPLRKLATPEDIARAAMFLLSDEAGHITMADLYVDGGATLRG